MTDCLQSLSDEPAVPIYDVKFNLPAFRWRVVVIAVPLGFMGVILAGAVAMGFSGYLPKNPFLVGLIIAVPMGLLIAAWSVIARRATRTQVGELLAGVDRETSPSAPWPPPDAFTQIRSEQAIEELGRALVRRGRVGFVLRDLRESDQAKVIPFDAPFQPLPLNRRDPAFRDLADAGNPGPCSLPPWRNRKRAVALTIMRYGGVGIMGWFFLSEVLLAIQTRSIHWKLCVYLAVTVSFVWSLMQPPNWTSRVQWALVPGGLVQRLPGRSSAWRLHLFRAPEAVAIITDRLDLHWRAFIVDANQGGWIVLHRDELDLLLRAWLSPCPTPTLDQLSDLV